MKPALRREMKRAREPQIVCRLENDRWFCFQRDALRADGTLCRLEMTQGGSLREERSGQARRRGGAERLHPGCAEDELHVRRKSFPPTAPFHFSCSGNSAPREEGADPHRNCLCGWDSRRPLAVAGKPGPGPTLADSRYRKILVERTEEVQVASAAMEDA